MTIPPDALANITDTFGGLAMCDGERRWCGTAISGFGILYNRDLAQRLGLPEPTRWEDLGSPRYFDLVGLADPTQSGSAAAAYEMIVQSADDWPSGWAKLLNILGNAKKFYAGAGDAAEAVPSGEAVAATCIDFYGTNRMSKYPKTLVYLSPKGQTAFNPDPVAILKNPPNPELAQRFVDFLLSEQGQALWALPAGHPDGPDHATLGRQPIRRDVYEKFGDQFSSAIVNPYAVGQSLEVDTELWADSYGLLRNLVWAAAVRNVDQLKAAKKKLIETDFEPERLALFNALPENVATREAIEETDALLSDDVQRDRIVTDWITWFRDKYERVAR
ncbi:MAG: extracellular solute-binding protein [Pseudomonadales bacterium]|nr:extracellular solute-binding protein [Pseudomonadales bacterium]